MNPEDTNDIESVLDFLFDTDDPVIKEVMKESASLMDTDFRIQECWEASPPNVLDSLITDIGINSTFSALFDDCLDNPQDQITDLDDCEAPPLPVSSPETTDGSDGHVSSPEAFDFDSAILDVSEETRTETTTIVTNTAGTVNEVLLKATDKPDTFILIPVSHEEILTTDMSEECSFTNNVYPELDLNEEEKKLLNKEGVSLPRHYPLTKEEERELKRIRRKIRNKQSALDSRQRKKEYITGLESRVKYCTTENVQLQKKMKLLEQENRSLMTQLRKLKAYVKNTTLKPTQTSTCLMVLVLSFALFLVPNMRLLGGKLGSMETSVISGGTSRTLLSVPPQSVINGSDGNNDNNKRNNNNNYYTKGEAEELGKLNEKIGELTERIGELNVKSRSGVEEDRRYFGNVNSVATDNAEYEGGEKEINDTVPYASMVTLEYDRKR